MIAGVVLAAGLSRRMGERKLLLDVHGKPLARWSVEALLPFVDDVVVVTGPDGAAVRDALTGLPVRFVVNPRPEDGQGVSIAAGIGALRPGTSAVVVALGDQPWLPDDVVTTLLQTFRTGAAAIVAPVYRGTQGTPVVFGAAVFPELATLAGDSGARPVVQRDRARVTLVPFDVDMPADVDTPADLERVTALLERVLALRSRRVQ